MNSNHQHNECGLRFNALSDVGMRRPMNQDAYSMAIAYDDTDELGHLFIVADGMGAHAAGELASQLAVEEVSRRYRTGGGISAVEALRNAISEANGVIHQKGQRDTQLYNMGTTCSALAIVQEGAIVGHVGDSRVYRCRNGVIQQLTFDHSLVWEMRAAGQVTSGDSSVPRNVITRCLGPHVEVEADLEGPFSVQTDDVFVLCSDGLTGKVSDGEIGVITTNTDTETAAQFLVDLANLRGGSDNITVVLTQVTDPKLNSPGQVNEQPANGSAQTGTHSVWWLLAGLGLLTAIFAFQATNLMLAAFGAATMAAAILGAGIQWWQQRNQVVAFPPLTAPYANAPAISSKSFVDSVTASLSMVLDGIHPSAHELGSLREEVDSIRQILQPDAQAVARLAALARRTFVAMQENPASVSSDSSVGLR